jgi:hypothetical protein
LFQRGWIFNGRQVTGVSPFTDGNNGPTQYFTRPGLGQRINKPNPSGSRHRTELLINKGHDFHL